MTTALIPSPAEFASPTEAPLNEADSAFMVELDEYSGPLDLLLTLIREHEVDIADIPVARIAEQFLRRISSLGLNDAADYLEMAARLLRIKAQMLLPRRESDEEWEDPRAELVRRLLEYQQVREVVSHLERRSDDRRGRFARAWLPTPAVTVTHPLSLALVELLAAVDRVLIQAKRPVVHDVIARALDVDGAISTVRAILALRAAVRWRELLAPAAERWQVLSLLLALLELARGGELHIEQSSPFADMEITRDVAGEAA